MILQPEWRSVSSHPYLGEIGWNIEASVHAETIGQSLAVKTGRALPEAPYQDGQCSARSPLTSNESYGPSTSVPIINNSKKTERESVASLRSVSSKSNVSVSKKPYGRQGPRTEEKLGSASTRSVKQRAAAEEKVLAHIAGLPVNTICCYTDGGCKPNPGPCGAACVVQFPSLPDGTPGLVVEQRACLGQGTNNVGELYAVLLALDVLRIIGISKAESFSEGKLDEHDRRLLTSAEQAVKSGSPVEIMTDSDYTVGMMMRGWKAKKNGDLIALLLREKALRNASNNRVTVSWHPGHLSLRGGNHRADELAMLACAENQKAAGELNVARLAHSFFSKPPVDRVTTTLLAKSRHSETASFFEAESARLQTRMRDLDARPAASSSFTFPHPPHALPSSSLPPISNGLVL